MPHELLASGKTISLGDDKTTGQVQDKLGISTNKLIERFFSSSSKLLIFSVDQPGLEPRTSRLRVS